MQNNLLLVISNGMISNFYTDMLAATNNILVILANDYISQMPQVLSQIS